MEELGPLFVHPSEPSRFWILVLAVSLPTIAIALIALVKGRLPHALSLPALAFLPIFTYVLGDIHLLEESKRVTFCGSCHESMSPILATMRSDGDYLSGKHYALGAVSYETACYQCHSGYGIWGGVNAKRAGLDHMLHTVTGDYVYPIQKRGPFNIDSCLNCHAEAQPFRAVEVHKDPTIQEALVSREMGCVGVCHPSAHPEEALLGAAAWQASQKASQKGSED